MEPLEKRSLLAAIGNGLSAAPDYYSLDEDTTLNVSAPGVLGNDAGTSAVLVASPANGAVSFFSDGSFTYTPLADWYGTDSFTYQALDGELISDEITVTLTVNDVPEPPPPAPVAGDDSYSTDEDTLLTIGGAGVLDNDQGQSITAAVTSGPSNGSVTMNPDGSFTYSPNADFHGSDSFAYTVTDSANQTDDAQVTITVNSVNDPPVAIDVGFSTYEDQQLMVYSSMGNGLLYGASDPDGDYNLTPQLVSQASHGYVDFSYYGSFIYTPAAEFSGTDSFTYQISDGNGGYSNVATVTIQVDLVNDAPVAVEDYFTLAEDDYTFTGNLLTNDSDIDSPTFSPTLATGVSNGNLIVQMDGSFVYNPYANFFGTDSFTYYVSDGLAQSNTVTVWLTITEVNDAPIGAPDSYSTNEDSGFWMTGSSGVLGNDYDAETYYLSLTATLITAPTNGTFWLQSDGGFQYTPNPDFYGEDTFTYQASDGQLLSEITTVTITVYPINDTPTASDQSYTLDEDTPLTITDPLLGLLAGAIDVDGPALSVSIYNQPQYGQLTLDDASTGAFTFIPAPDYNGNDSFTYLVSDGSLSALVAGVLVITSVNDKPIAVDDSFRTNENSPLEVSAAGVLGNDYDREGQALSAFPVDGPSHGVLAPDLQLDGSFTYIPHLGYQGEDSFTYRISDGDEVSEVATVFITVDPINFRPEITSDGGGSFADVNVNENQTAVTTVTGEDLDVGTILHYSISGGDDAGSFTIDDLTGVLRFIQAPDFENPTDANGNGVYFVEVTAADDFLPDTQLIAVTVNDVNEAPEITSNGGGDSASVQVVENETAVITVTARDPDAGDSWWFTVAGGLDADKFTIGEGTGALSFVTPPDYEVPTDSNTNNVYTVIVEVTDGELTDTQMIHVTVTDFGTLTITSDGGDSTAELYVQETETEVTTVTANDTDTSSTQTFTVSGGADADKFTIDSQTGELSFIVAPDYESPTDADQNNVYEVIVQVANNDEQPDERTDEQAISVTVTDVVPFILVSGGGTVFEVMAGDSTAPVDARIARFEFKRIGDLNSPLDVPIAVTGTAGANDYTQGLGTVIHFGVNDETIERTFTVVDDNVVEEAEDVRVTVALEDDYIVFGGNERSATIIDNDFWRWRDSNLTQGGLVLYSTEQVDGYSTRPWVGADLDIALGLVVDELVQDWPFGNSANGVSPDYMFALGAYFHVPHVGYSTDYEIEQDFNMSFDFNDVTGDISMSGAFPTDKVKDRILEGAIAWNLQIDNSGESTHKVELTVQAMIGIEAPLTMTYTSIHSEAADQLSASLAGSRTNAEHIFDSDAKTFTFYLDAEGISYANLLERLE